MTHHPDTHLYQTVLQQLTEQGTSSLAECLRVLLNEAMVLERSVALQAGPHERIDTRLGYANGFKPKTIATRVGALEVAIPQVRGDVTFYPKALEKGVRSEQALVLAMAEPTEGR